MLRSKTNWVKAGKTTDFGIGSCAKGRIADLSAPDRSKLENLYSQVVQLVEGESESLQQAILTAAASEYALDAICAKADEKPAQAFISVDDEARNRAVAEVGDKQMHFEDYMVIFEKHKKAVQAERKAIREKRNKASQGEASQGKASQGEASQGKASQGKASQGKASQGKASQGKAQASKS